MSFVLPADLYQRVQQLTLAGYGTDDADVLRKALDAAAWAKQEELAILEGIAACEAGDCEPWEDFSARFRREHGID